MSHLEMPAARPLFRNLALGAAVVCVILAAIFGIARPQDGMLTPGNCLFVDFVMVTIGTTGY